MSLRFVPLIRVSTEKQAYKGESLRTQNVQIRQYVKSLNGIIPENCLAYSGQEHATPDMERSKLDQLLQDSSKNKFDAVIVCDTSRWSRDNLKSKEGLNILRSNGIRFFVGTVEYDLYNPEHNFILGMSAEVGELQARQQALKSITNRIEKARRGIPTGGKLPYGRTYNKETNKWGIDSEKKKNIEWAAKEYLNGKSVVKLSNVLGMGFTNLWKILTKRSGPEWDIKFNVPKLNINEMVTLQIPPLLNEETIKAIKLQSSANKTYHHGEIKHQYLLSRVIFCKHCGYALVGQTNHGGSQYYRHPRQRKNGCCVTSWIPAKVLGEAVIVALLQTFGDRTKIQEALERAIPNFSEISKMRDDLELLKKKEKKLIERREKLIALASDDILTDEEVSKQIVSFREQLRLIKNHIGQTEIRLDSIPASDEIKKKSVFAGKVLLNILKHPSDNLIEKFLNSPFERQRQLIEYAFSGKDANGRDSVFILRKLMILRDLGGLKFERS